jgi:hypothetical protein
MRRLFLAFLILAAGCAPREQKDKDQLEQVQLLTIAGIAYLDNGNCARSYRAAANSGQLYCSRAPRSLCIPDQAFFTLSPLTVYGRLYVTKETQDRYRAEWAYLVSDFPSCTTSSASASALSYPGFKLQTSTQAADAFSRFSFSVLDDCSSLSNSNAGKLANRSQYSFLTSPRGVLAWQAKALGQTACFNDLPMSNEERQTVTEYVSGAVILETACNYGTSAAPNNCTAAEKAQAYSFDFTGSL